MIQITVRQLDDVESPHAWNQRVQCGSLTKCEDSEFLRSWRESRYGGSTHDHNLCRFRASYLVNEAQLLCTRHMQKLAMDLLLSGQAYSVLLEKLPARRAAMMEISIVGIDPAPNGMYTVVPADFPIQPVGDDQ